MTFVYQEAFVAGVAAIGTAVWAMLVARASLATVLLALIFVGCAAAVAVFCATISSAEQKMDVDIAMAAILALVFAAYQGAGFAAFAANGALSQAIINCNIVFILVHKIATEDGWTSDALATLAAAILYVLLGAFIAFYK